MKADLIYTKSDKWILSKVSAHWRMWQDKFYHYQASLSYPDITDLIEFLKEDFKISDENALNLLSVFQESKCDYFELSYLNNTIDIAELQLDLLNSKGEIIDWKDWNYFFTKTDNDEYHLWVFVGGIADITREIKLNIDQVNSWEKQGLDFVINLASELQRLESTAYSEAIEENRKLI